MTLRNLLSRSTAALLVLALQAVAGAPGAPVEEKTSSVRADMNLNGEWDFAPASSKLPPQDGWGRIMVPGGWSVVPSWTGVQLMVGGIVKTPAEPITDDLASGWYARTLEIPQSWSGRAVELELTRVSTDAEVYLNGVRCGEIHWPNGTVDLSAAVRFGQPNVLQVLVFAVQTEKELTVFMGSEQNLQWKKKATLDAKGIIGEAFLHSRPAGAHVSDVFVKTSTRKRRVALEIELAGVKTAGDVTFTASMLAPDGRCEKVFSRKAAVQARDLQVVDLDWSWPHPRLWDVGKPELYRLVLKAEGAGLADEYPQAFGFREFWIEGRAFFLNGSEIRLRPIIAPEVRVAHPAHMDRLIDNMTAVGWNIAEFWPSDILTRGTVHWRSLWYERADAKGFLVTGTLPSINDIILKEQWTNAAQRAAYTRQVAAELRKYRNHPSVVLSAISANFFGYNQDPNPWLIGSRFISNDQQKHRTEECLEAITFVKGLDPTRPVFSHQGGWAGDMQTLNGYLNMMPLQEREEYLSHDVQHGLMPFMIVEGGTPFVYTFCRARHGFDEGRTSEPLATEYCAIYQGRGSYAVEPADYRKMIASKLSKKQPPDVADRSHDVNAHGQIYDIIPGDQISNTPQVQELERLFIQNTWRSWRTMGTCALMIPWSMSDLGWQHNKGSGAAVNLPPSNRGWAPSTVIARDYDEYSTKGSPILPAGQAVASNSQPALAWICGAHAGRDVADVTAKDHSFFAGRPVAKSVAIINDSREEQPYTATWIVDVAGRPVATRTRNGSLEPAGIAFVPVSFTAPQAFDGIRADGVITLTAKIGTQTIEDRFPFRVVRKAVIGAMEPASLVDPVGKTAAMLKEAGVKTAAWRADATSGVLLVGREYFNDHDRLPEGAREFVDRGGRLVIFAQDPARLKDLFNFRIAHQMPRSVFGIDAKHPVMAGLDDADLCNWAGSSTLAPERERPEIPYTQTPFHVWKWGNRGGLSGAAIEKPHHSSWRPILECEFDLAYTPLMELDSGRGRVILCTLDLEDYASSDPVATHVLANLLAYATSAPVRPAGGRTVYLGGEAGSRLLDSMGLLYDKVQEMPPADAGLAVVGADATADLTPFLQRGGKALYLARQTNAPFGVTLQQAKSFHGSLAVPAWPESAGLSPSDLRFRVDLPWSIVASGAETGAGGLLARVRHGTGMALLCQLDPSALNVEAQSYLRFTRWRQTRALAQLLANLGARFSNDDRIFTLRRDEISLAGLWDAKVIKVLEPPVLRWAETSERQKELVGVPAELGQACCTQLDADLRGWKKAWVPGGFEWMVPEHPGADGMALFRRVVTIPDEWQGRTLLVDFDKCMNGLGAVVWDGKPLKRVGGPNWDWPVVYEVAAGMATPGRHVLCVQLVNVWGESRLGFSPDNMRIHPQPEAWKAVGWYHPDYRRDREYGDDPYRYVRW